MSMDADDLPPVEAEDDDQIPPAWMSEPGAWEDVQIEQYPHLDYEEALQGDDADVSPARESHTPNYLADDASVIEIFTPDTLKPFADAKAQREALRKVAK